VAIIAFINWGEKSFVPTPSPESLVIAYSFSTAFPMAGAIAPCFWVGQGVQPRGLRRKHEHETLVGSGVERTMVQKTDAYFSFMG
jgi:hypothetical protein